MNLKRIGTLLGKDFKHGSKSFIFIFAIATPLVISFVMTMIFGSIFDNTPKMGLYDSGNSQLVALAEELNSVDAVIYESSEDLRNAIESGSADMGILLPADIDSAISQGQPADITAYVCGESLAKDRTIIRTAVSNLIRDLAGQEVPVAIDAITLGDENNVPWEDRLLPFVVLFAVILAGSMVPATALVDEKQKKTLKALVVTPTTLAEVFASKALMGIILSLVMGVLILIINQAFGSQPLLLIMTLALGSILASEFGLLLGAYIKDINTLFATMKGIGILFYAPAVVYLFPEIPEWIGRIFPTYYIVQPVVEISQQGAGWSDISLEIFILVGIILVGLVAVWLSLKKVGQQEI